MRYYKYRALWEQVFVESLKDANNIRAEGFTIPELITILTKKLKNYGVSWEPLNPTSAVRRRLIDLHKEGKVLRKEIMPYGFKKVIVWKYIGGEKDGGRN